MTHYKIDLEKSSTYYKIELSDVKIPIWVIDTHKYEIAEKVKEWLNVEAPNFEWTVIEILNVLNSPQKILPFGDYAMCYDFKKISLYKRNTNLVLIQN